MKRCHCGVRPSSRPSVSLLVSNRSAGSARQRSTRCHAAATAKVSLRLPMNTKLGESLAVVGNAGVLGQWEAGKAVALQWTEGSIWTSEIDLPIGETVEYKYIVRREGGGVTWQAGANLTLTLPEGAVTAEVCDSWQGVHESMKVEQQEAQPAAATTTALPLEAAAAEAAVTSVLETAVPSPAPAQEQPVAAATLEEPAALQASTAATPSAQPSDNPLDKIKEQLEGLLGEKGRMAQLGLLSLLGLGSTSALLAMFFNGKAGL